jgi:hypothetical protein
MPARSRPSRVPNVRNRPHEVHERRRALQEHLRSALAQARNVANHLQQIAEALAVHDEQSLPVDRLAVPFRKIGKAPAELYAFVEPMTFELRPRGRIVALPREERAEQGVRFAVGGFGRNRRPRRPERTAVIAQALAHERERDERQHGRGPARREAQRGFAIASRFGEPPQFVVCACAIDVEHGVFGMQGEPDPASVDRRSRGAVRVAKARDVGIVQRLPHPGGGYIGGVRPSLPT